MSNDDEGEAIAASHLPHHEAFWDLLPKCYHATHLMHGTDHSSKMSKTPYPRPILDLPIVMETSNSVAPGTHRALGGLVAAAV